MAAVVNYKGGLRRVEFSLTSNGPRKVLRLGRVSAKTAAGWKAKLETIIADKALRRPHDPEVAAWLASLDERVLARLRDLGLAAGVGLTDTTLGGWIDTYIASRGDTKPATITTYKRAKAKLLAHFKAETYLCEITPGHADEFARWLRTPAGGSLAEATARRTTSIAKQIMRAAVRRRLLDANPFQDLVGTVPPNRKRDHFVTRADADKILEHCPDHEWRVIFALARFAALRCPTEIMGLRLQDIDWARNRMLVRSVKTEHHAGKDCRTVPIVPELLPYLRDAFERAADGAEFVVTRYRDPGQNLRTQLGKIIRRAGFKAWPKLWQNLRSSCVTEWAARFPSHVCSAWAGHSAHRRTVLPPGHRG